MKNLPEVAKEPFRKLAKDEKAAMGSNFRRNIMRISSQVTAEEKKKRKMESDKKYKSKLKCVSTWMGDRLVLFFK